MQDSKRDTAIKNRLLATIWIDKKKKKKNFPKNEYDVTKGIPRMFHTYLKLLLSRVTLLMLPSGHFLQLCFEFSLENIEEACTEPWVSNLAPGSFLTKILVSKSPCLIYILGFQTIFHIKMFENLVYLILH